MYPPLQDQYQALSAEDRSIYDRIRFSETIEGWLFVSEAVGLYKGVMSLKRHPAVICEIGTWMGKSGSILGKAAIDRGDARVYCIDPFTGIGERASKETYTSRMATLQCSLQHVCEENFKRVEVDSVITLWPFSSEDARAKFGEPAIDGLFIDGDHSFEGVMSDVERWSPLVVSGGWMILHDVGAVHVDGPRLVMADLQENHPEWTDWQMIGEMGACRRR